MSGAVASVAFAPRRRPCSRTAPPATSGSTHTRGAAKPQHRGGRSPTPHGSPNRHDGALPRRLADGSEPPADGLLRGFVNDLLAAWPDGRIKLWLTARLLRLREREPRLVLHGNYVPLIVDGARSARVVAFARRYEDRVLITIVPRLVAGMVHAEHGWPITDAVWQDTVVRLPGNLATARLRNAITGDVASIVAADGAPTVAVGEVLRNCPVAVLISG